MQIQEIIASRNHERSEAYRLYEEKTDLGERLSLPIHNTPRLEVIEGHVYGRDVEGDLKRMTEWSKEAYKNSLLDMSFTGPNRIERERREIEYRESLEVETMQPGEALYVLSPVPDAVMNGETSIQGYRKDLARTFFRAYHRVDGYVETITLSLEQSNKEALRQVGDMLGMDLPEDMQSEAVLAARHKEHVSVGDFMQLADRVRYHYDKSLYAQTGEVFFAGNRLAGKKDSMRFIDENRDIVDEHMSVRKSLEDRFRGDQLNKELEMLRQRTAAALDERLHGGAVTSISDSSVSERMSTHEYGGECATGSQQSTIEQMGLTQGKHTTNCPLCGTRGVTATVEGETITCSDCRGSVDICTGKVTQGTPRKQRREMTNPLQATNRTDAKVLSKRDHIEAKYGKHIVIKKQKIIGGEVSSAYDKKGRLLAERI